MRAVGHLCYLRRRSRSRHERECKTGRTANVSMRAARGAGRGGTNDPLTSRNSTSFCRAHHARSCSYECRNRCGNRIYSTTTRGVLRRPSVRPSRFDCKIAKREEGGRGRSALADTERLKAATPSSCGRVTVNSFLRGQSDSPISSSSCPPSTLPRA